MSTWFNKILFVNDLGYSGRFIISFDVETSDTGAQHYFRIFYTDGTSEYSAARAGSCRYKAYTAAGKVVKSISATWHHDARVSITNMCISMAWSGKRDGEYEPYWEETKALPLTTLRGRLNGKGSSVVVFPDGMKRAGDVCDEIKVENGVTKAIKRVREMRIEGGELVSSLYDEPQTYILDDFELPVVYRIDDFGTERIVSPEGSVAPMLVTRYGVNAVDTLRRLPVNYISARSEDEFLAKLSAATGCVWSKSWSDERGCWVYTVEGEPKTWNIQYLGVLNDGANLGVKINGEENDSLFSEIKEGDTLDISDREFSNLAFLKVVSASRYYITAMGVEIGGKMLTFVMSYSAGKINARLKQIG